MNEELANRVELTTEIVKKYVCPLATNEEIYVFLQLCKFQNLNPFLREVYLIKYSATQPASMVTGKDLFLKRASRNEQYDGFKAGVVAANSKNEMVYREGGIVFTGERLIGGWAEVYRKDRRTPARSEVVFDEYVGMKPIYENSKKTDKEELNKQWRSKPATMIRKVALVQALREAFPDELEGLSSVEEMPHIEISTLPEYSTDNTVAGYIPEPQRKSEKKDPPPEGEPSIKDKLHQELSLYCQYEDGTVDMEMYANVLKEVSLFTGKDQKGKEKEYSIEDIFNEKVSDKWAGKALGNLRKKLENKPE